jgi:biotin transport system ATP-binding protein
VVEVRHLTHRFDDGVVGLDDVSLTLSAGEFVVVAGPNGAGKSLLMRHLVGLATPTSGEVLWHGLDVRRQLPEVRCHIGLVFQDSGAQILGLTVREDVAFGPRNLGCKREQVEKAVAESLAAVGLSTHVDQPCAQLSGGELRRLAIAGVLAMNPSLLVLDEPFTGLDYPAVQAVLRALTTLQRRGITVVVLTHELDKCLALATRLVLMQRARILADGTPADLWDRIPEAEVHRPRGPVTLLETMTWLA